MKCVKTPVIMYYIAYSVCNRQGEKELNFIYGRKGKNAVSSLLKVELTVRQRGRSPPLEIFETN